MQRTGQYIVIDQLEFVAELSIKGKYMGFNGQGCGLNLAIRCCNSQGLGGAFLRGVQPRSGKLFRFVLEAS